MERASHCVLDASGNILAIVASDQEHCTANRVLIVPFSPKCQMYNVCQSLSPAQTHWFA